MTLDTYERAARARQLEATMARGAELISTERQRQIEEEGFTTEHDDQHDPCELLVAALCYAGIAGSQIIDPDADPNSEAMVEAATIAQEAWPWGKWWWKPADNPMRNLVKAGALIAAQIDRLQRRADVHE